MKSLNDYILEKKLEEIYGFLYEDPINEGVIRDGLKKAWEWIKSKFRRKKNPYMDDYFYKRAYKPYEYDTEPLVTHSNRKVNAIDAQKTINRLLNKNEFTKPLEKKGQLIKAAEIYNADDKLSGIIVYSKYKTKHGVNRFIILGLESIDFDDPELMTIIKKIAKQCGCISPMYVSKTEYEDNEYFYQKEKFEVVFEDRGSTLCYAKKEF